MIDGKFIYEVIVMKKAFTLIELLIVVAIIGILAAIAVPNFLNAQSRAKLARTYADLKSIQTAIGAYAVDNNSAPVDRGTEYGDGSSYISLTTPVAYLSSIDACRDVWANELVEPGRKYMDSGAPLRSGASESEIATRRREYANAGVTYVQIGCGPDGDTDFLDELGSGTATAQKSVRYWTECGRLFLQFLQRAELQWGHRGFQRPDLSVIIQYLPITIH